MKNGRPRGRPRAFDRDQALETALELFWRQGYEGTSVADLTAALGIKPPSLYAAFGSKEGLYLEALKAIFTRKASPVAALTSIPSAGSPGAREAALRGLRDYIRAFITELMSCDGTDPIDEAAMVLMAREMQSPRKTSAPLLLEHLAPYVTHLTSCLQVLRPDLDEEALFNMGVSIQGQIIHFRNSLGIIRLLRGSPDYPQDLEKHIQHYTDFSLRGLGVPEAFPQPRP